MKILKIALIIVILIIVILAITGTNIFGAVLVNDISLEKRGDSTFVTIMSNSSFQFNSSSVPAKEGRPFRILIDCKDALHNLSRYDFRNLPSGIVTSIRTSQYQTDPKRVVRIVLDAAKTVNYKVNPVDNSVVITLLSLGEPDFERWFASSTSQPAPATTSVETTEPVPPAVTPDQPEVSTTPETEVPPEPTTAVEPTETPAASEATSSTETIETTEPAAVSAEAETPTETPASATEPSPSEAVVTEPITTEPSTTLTEVPSGETTVSSDTQPASVSSEVATTPEVIDTTAPPTELTPTEEAPVTPSEPSSKAMVKKETKKASPVEPKVAVKVTPPTAIEEEGEAIVRVVPSQIQEKALQAIETFPKRRMVQYRTHGKRDPFAPLIGEKKVTEFGQAPIPSIENLKLVGILQDFQGNKALLEDNRGYGYIMEPGDRVRNGSVVLVDEDRVIFQILEYGWSRNVALDLYNVENK